MPRRRGAGGGRSGEPGARNWVTPAWPPPSQRPPGRPPTGPTAPASRARLGRHSPLGPGAPPRSWPAPCRLARPECAAQAQDLRSLPPPPWGPRPKLRPQGPRTEATAACPPGRPPRPPSPGPAGPALPPAASHHLRRQAPDPPARPPSAPPAAAAPPHPPNSHHQPPALRSAPRGRERRHSQGRAQRPQRSGAGQQLSAPHSAPPQPPQGLQCPLRSGGELQVRLGGGEVGGSFSPFIHQ